MGCVTAPFLRIKKPLRDRAGKTHAEGLQHTRCERQTTRLSETVTASEREKLSEKDTPTVTKTSLSPDQELFDAIEAALPRVQRMEELGLGDHFYTSTLLTKFTFPHSPRSADKRELALVNGDLEVVMYSPKGLPYGHYPRLILLWLTRECARRHAVLPLDEARVIPLGESLNGFLKQVGILPKNGRANSTNYKAVQRQLERLFRTTISTSWSRSGDDEAPEYASWENMTITSKGFLWWDTNDNNDEVTWGESYIELSQEFFTSVAEHKFPLDVTHVIELRRSPMALDLYTWLAQRLHGHRGVTRVKWEQLRGQFGSGYPLTGQGMRDFKKAVRTAMAAVKRAWPDAGISEFAGGVMLTGSVTPIERKCEDWSA